MSNDMILTHDRGVEAFDDAGGVVNTADDTDGVSFDWDEEHIVTVDAPADLEGAFDTNRFYKVEDATIARPIKQPYLMGDSVEWFKKPAEELQKAAWSFDNAPFTLDHPDSGMVRDVNDIHGFWRNASYLDSDDRLTADLYVPENDDEALKFIEENQDVSPGFYNRKVAEYSGDTGDLTDDDVDGFQVDLYANHVAGVETGRCSGSDGCGLDADHGVVVDTDVDRIQQKAHDMGCDVPETDEDTDNSPEATEDCGCNDTMTDENDFDVPDLSVDALADKNDAVADLKEERDSLESDLDEMEAEVEEALDSAENFSVELGEDECVCEAVEQVVEDLDEKAEEVDDLTDELDEYRAEEKQEALDSLEDLGGDREEYEDESLDSIEEEVERRKEVLESTDADVSVKDIDTDSDVDEDADSDADTEHDGRDMDGNRTFSRGYNA